MPPGYETKDMLEGGCRPRASIDIRAQARHSAAFLQSPFSRSRRLANTVQAKKRARQAEIHRQRNVAFRSQMRTAIKKVLKATLDKDASAGQTAFREASSVIDRGISRGLVHRNTGARYKSRLNARLHRLSTTA